MKNLIVTVDGNVRDVGVDEVGVLIAIWLPIASIIEDKMKYVEIHGRAGELDLGLEWKLSIGMDKFYPRHTWNCEVSMTCKLNTGDGKTSIPITTVKLELKPDGKFRWIDVAEHEQQDIDLLVEALSFGYIGKPGKLRYFRRNWFPIVKKLGDHTQVS